MPHLIRLLEVPTRADVEREMRRTGSEEAGVRIMAPKGEWYALRVENLRGKAAALLKQGMLVVGGEAAVARGVAGFDDTPAPVVLVGDRRHYGKLAKKLLAEPFGLKDLAGEITALLARLDGTPAPVRCGRWELHCDGRAAVMGIINTTPDSFSGDGLGDSVAAAVQQGREFAAAGADLLDIGGESTRPGSEGVSAEEELRRVIPVIEALAAEVDMPLSVDTSKPEVARAALQAGATLINDVWALRQPGMIELAAETGAAVCLMHMQGQPRDMQHEPHYEDVLTEVYGFLAERCEAAMAGGIAESQIIVDPGIGFGKTVDHNLELIRRLRELRSLGRPVLLGASRKRTLGELTGKPVEERMVASVAAHTAGIMNGADIVRVHDVAATIDAVKVAAGILGRDHTRPAVRPAGANA